MTWILMMSNGVAQRGEIWSVNFDPVIGQEIQKTRPAVVMEIKSAYRLNLHIVVPFTTWQPRFQQYYWMVQIISDTQNGLNADSAANVFQLKSVAQERFQKKIGQLTSEQIQEIASTIALMIGYTPPNSSG